MTLHLTSRLERSIPGVSGLYYRLVLAVGPASSGKTAAFTELAEAKGWARVNVNLQLSERLLDLTHKQRAVRITGLLDEIVKAVSTDVVLLDNIELLFAVELAQDPLRLLQGQARNRTLVASWPGLYNGQALTYAEPGHREYRKYVAPQAAIVSTADAQPIVAAKEENR